MIFLDAAALCTPVDLPLLPSCFVHAWTDAVRARPATRASHDACSANLHPALCDLHEECFMDILESVEAGKRRVQSILQELEGFWTADVADFADPVDSVGL
jgi:molybdopterin-guanine dinucleotide biosynthesis protein A